jgi:hypothetical protein
LPGILLRILLLTASRGKRDPGRGFRFNDSVEILVNTLDGPTVGPLGIDDFLQIGRRFLDVKGGSSSEGRCCAS